MVRRMWHIVGMLVLLVPCVVGAAEINGNLTLHGRLNSCDDAGSTDTYACTISPPIQSYRTGTRYSFKANTANTGAATINLNGKGARNIVKTIGGITTTLADNDIRAGLLVELLYDGTNMQCLNCWGNTTQTIASGTLALATAAIASGTCAAAQTASAAGTITTDVILANFNADVTGVTGYTAATTGTLRIDIYPTSNTVNARVCNNTSASITPGAVTLNFRVVR